MPSIETAIERVTVYTERAQVTRKGSIRLESGVHRLEVENLPQSLASETVRARATSTSRARLLSTDTVQTFHRERPEAKQAVLEARLKELQEADEALVQRESSVATRRVFVQSLANSAGTELARGIALGRVGVDTGASLAEFLAEQLNALESEAIGIAQQRREIAIEVDILKSQLKSHQQKRPVERRTVVVQLEMETEGDLVLEISYQVSEASWTPLYDLRVSEVGDRPLVSLVYQAQVTQLTGENWTAVALTLSTAKPAASAFPPQLQPWYLHAQRPVAVASPVLRRTMMEGAVASPPLAMSTVAMGAVDDYLFQEAEVETATVNESGPVLSFGLSGGTDVPSDGSPHKVTLSSHEFPARLDYVTAPKLINQAFRRARSTNESNLVLLPGIAQIFNEDEFIGTSRLKTIAPGQDVELFLGVDDRVHVARKLVLGSVDRKFLADVRRMGYGYEVTVTNLRDRPETVTVLDQIPVSRHESVKVRRGEVKPEPNEQTEMGNLRWELRLEPRQSRTVRFGFSIEAPRDLALSGLPPLSEEGAIEA